MCRPSDLSNDFQDICRNYLALNRKVKFLKKLIPLIEKAWDENFSFALKLIGQLSHFLKENPIFHLLDEGLRDRINKLLKTAGENPAVPVSDTKDSGVYGIYIDQNHTSRGCPFRIWISAKKTKKSPESQFWIHTNTQFENVKHLNFWKNNNLQSVQFLSADFEKPTDEIFSQSSYQGESAELAMFLAILHNFLMDDSDLKRQKIFATGRIEQDGKVGRVQFVEEKLNIILEEHPDIDLVFLPAANKKDVQRKFPDISILFVDHINQIWEKVKDHIAPFWLTDSIYFINNEIQYVRSMNELQGEFQWISGRSLRKRYEDLVYLGLNYLQKEPANKKSLPSFKLIQMAEFYKQAAYYFNHYGSLIPAGEMYKKFEKIYEILRERGDVPPDIIHTLNQRAIYHRDLYDYRKSIRILDEVISWKGFRYLANIEKATWYRSRAQVAMDLFDLDLAEKYLKKSAKIVHESRDSQNRQLNFELELYCLKNDKKNARRRFEKIYNALEQSGWRDSFAVLYSLKYHVLLNLSFSKDFENKLHSFLNEIKNEYSYIIGMISHWYARYLKNRNDLSEAIKWMTRSCQSFEKENSPDLHILRLGNVWLISHWKNNEERKNHIFNELRNFDLPSFRKFFHSYIKENSERIIRFLHY